MNASPELACVVASGPHGKMEGSAAEIQGTFLNVPVEVESEEGQNQGPEVGSLERGCVLVEH